MLIEKLRRFANRGQSLWIAPKENPNTQPHLFLTHRGGVGVTESFIPLERLINEGGVDLHPEDRIGISSVAGLNAFGDLLSRFYRGMGRSATELGFQVESRLSKEGFTPAEYVINGVVITNDNQSLDGLDPKKIDPNYPTTSFEVIIDGVVPLVQVFTLYRARTSASDRPSSGFTTRLRARKP